MILFVRTMHYTINKDHNHPTQPSLHTHRDRPCCSSGHNRTAIPTRPRSVFPAARPQSQRKAPTETGGAGPHGQALAGQHIYQRAAYIPAAGRSASVSVGGPGPAPALALATAPPPRRGVEAASQGQQPPAMAAPVLSTGPMPGPAVSSIWVHIYSYLITMWPYLCPLNSSHCTILVRHTTCTMVQHNIPHHTVLIITVLPIHQLPALSTHAFLICWWHAGPLPMHVVSTHHIVYSHGPCNT
jgi:hypothetical protein